MCINTNKHQVVRDLRSLYLKKSSFRIIHGTKNRCTEVHREATDLQLSVGQGHADESQIVKPSPHKKPTRNFQKIILATAEVLYHFSDCGGPHSTTSKAARTPHRTLRYLFHRNPSGSCRCPKSMAKILFFKYYDKIVLDPKSASWVANLRCAGAVGQSVGLGTLFCAMGQIMEQNQSFAMLSERLCGTKGALTFCFHIFFKNLSAPL